MRVLALLAIILLAGCAAAPTAPSTSQTSASPASAGHGATGQGAPASSTSTAAAKTLGAIRGVVVDEALHPVANATVRITTVDRSTTSGPAGTFRFEGLPPGSYFLEVRHPSHRTVQTSAKVVAGETDPAAVNVVMPVNPDAKPRVDVYKMRLIVSSSYCLPATGCDAVVSGKSLTEEAWDYFWANVEPNATVLQTEVQWTPATPLASTAAYTCRVSGKDASESYPAAVGASPLLVRMQGSLVGKDGATGTARQVNCPLTADPAAVPAGALVNQEASAVLHAFYNIEPPADWRFSRDGDFPVPA
ncbi:MAG TPA: carboxypeptidase-like regulatory domain-containing protein [Candidatus Thermoplasmatota archaeon]|nr:carboxypeptidase-like regulatory domain-containing protein [Candidatus Thermoplasmatota archaeon]